MFKMSFYTLFMWNTVDLMSQSDLLYTLNYHVKKYSTADSLIFV